jgi:phosphate transport system permease protein
VEGKFWRRGEPYVWATGLSLTLVLLLTLLLLYVVIANGITMFWPREVVRIETTDGNLILGEITREDRDPISGGRRIQLKTGNREIYGSDFRWIGEDEIRSLSYPEEIIVLERLEYGNFYGFFRQVLAAPGSADSGEREVMGALARALEIVEQQRTTVQGLNRTISRMNDRLEKGQHQLARLTYKGKGESPAARDLVERAAAIQQEFSIALEELNQRRDELEEIKGIFVEAGGQEKEVVLADIVRYYRPNAMSPGEKIAYYLVRLKELLFAEPRESNTEGGLFPAIFGTVMLVFMMSIFSFPFGVLAGIYLREYAKEGILVKTVRIAVNNLAGIPSIVYGIFGLGFFVYGIGAQLDQLFFPERLPAPTFGTGGILWASLTLGLLTLPVVIVATEEALGSIPPGIREGSQALGATKFQTLAKLLLPMASPGILTGFILAMARAAGEVAPLMITGVVKLAPALPIDGSFPYLHLDRKFMHLGFHIYDIGFQSPNVEAAKPMVYVTTLLLILIVLVMTSTAIYLRNKMRKRYSVVDV